MSLTKEQMMNAKSIEELQALAKENGEELTIEQCKKYFTEYHKEAELSDNELGAIAGGKGEPDPLYNKYDDVRWHNDKWGDKWYVLDRAYDSNQGTWIYTLAFNGHYEYNIKESDIEGRW